MESSDGAEKDGGGKGWWKDVKLVVVVVLVIFCCFCTFCLVEGEVQTTNRKVWLVDTLCDNLQSVATTEGETMHMPLVGPKSKLSLERKILVASIWICMKSLGLLP